MKKTIKNKKYYSQEGILAKVENYYLPGKVILAFFDFFFYIVRKLVFSKNKSGNIIIISLHRLGDTVFTIPAVKEIFKNYKDSNKTILCYPESKNIYNLVFKEEIQTINKNDFIFGGRFAAKIIRKNLKSLNPQLIFDSYRHYIVCFNNF